MSSWFSQTLSLINRAWKSGYDVLMLTTDTWQLAWRPTDINIANYTFYYPNTVSRLCCVLNYTCSCTYRWGMRSGRPTRCS